MLQSAAQRGQLLKTGTSQKHDNNARKRNIAIIPHLFVEKASKFHLDELIALLSPLTNRVFVVTGGLAYSASGVEMISTYSNSTYGVEIVPIKATARTSVLSKAIVHIS